MPTGQLISSARLKWNVSLFSLFHFELICSCEIIDLYLN